MKSPDQFMGAKTFAGQTGSDRLGGIADRLGTRNHLRGARRVLRLA